MLTTLALISLLVGVAFSALGVFGVLRFPDVYTRLHADTKATTFGSIFIALSVVLYAVQRLLEDGGSHYFTLIVHVFIAVSVLAFTNATGAHAIARAAHRSGVEPQQALVNQLKSQEGEQV